MVHEISQTSMHFNSRASGELVLKKGQTGSYTFSGILKQIKLF